MLPAARPAAARPRPRAHRRRGARSASACTTRSPRRPRRWPTGWPRAGTTRAAGGRPRPTVAVLVRARKQLPGIAAALRERGVPVEVVGLGGLLEVPEVSDVVATLHRAGRPHRRRRARPAAHRCAVADRAARPRRAGGPRAGAGPRPPARAGRTSRRGAAPAEPPSERGSIIEALDDLGGPDAYSPAGYRAAAPARRRAARTCARRLSESLPDLVDEVARTLGLETELASAPGRQPGRCPRAPRRAARRRRRVHRAGRAAVAAGLPRLPARRRGAGARAGARRGRGQPGGGPAAHRALRARASSGTSSPCPGMTKDQFPAKADTSDSWIKDPGAVPAELRLTDRDELPRLRLPVPGSRRPGGACKQALDNYVAGVEGLRHRRGDPARLRRGHPRPAPAAVLGQLVARRQDRVRARRRCCRRSAPPCEAGAGDVVHWAEAPADDATNPALEEWPVGQWPADPLAVRPAPRADRRAPSWSTAAAPHPLDAERVLAERRPARSSSGCATPTCCCASGPGTPARRVDVPLPSHLSVSALVTLRRDPAELARRLRRPMPRRAGAAGPPGHRVPRLAGGALRRGRSCSTSTSCPAPATSSPRPTARSPSCRRRSWPASGPTGSRPRSRCRSRRRSGPLTLRGRIDAVFADARRRLRGHRLEDRPPPSGRRAAPPPRCSWPPTGWAGRG